MFDRYILLGRLPVPEPDLHKWGEWIGEIGNKRVAETLVGPIWVSTVFLGLDHGFGFSDHADAFLEDVGDYQTRCSTWDEAEKQHAEAVAWARELVERVDAGLAATLNCEDKT